MNVSPCAAHEHINLFEFVEFVIQTMELRSHLSPTALEILQHCTYKVCMDHSQNLHILRVLLSFFWGRGWPCGMVRHFHMQTNKAR